jgi:hypothetical protein
MHTSRLDNGHIHRDQAWVFEGLHSRIMAAMAQRLAQPSSLAELTTALKEMANDKLLGLDKFIIELYKSLWPVIGDKYLVMIQDSISKGAFPSGVTEGLIVLLHKGGGRSTLNNWKPITLLKVAYKIFAKTLQMRLQLVLMAIISSEESAFLSMWFTLDNIFLTYETIHHAKQSRQPLLFLKLDF